MARRKLEELNLIDDFLFQELISHGAEGEEFCRIFLSIVLGRRIKKVRVLTQKVILGPDTDRHGVRLDAYIEDISGNDTNNCETSAKVDIQPDIYDIEPNKIFEKKSLPRRTRYYHGLIDSKLLEGGAGYEKLQNVVIIMILPYDPFGADRMVYTVKNQITEDPSIPYEDGMAKIYLYTKGCEGNPSQSLKEMLQYIESSRQENIKNADLGKIHHFVEKIKRDKEVGINYMKSWEWEELIKKEAIAEGLAEGRAEGEMLKFISLVLKKNHKNHSPERIADDLEEDISMVKNILCVVEGNPNFDKYQIYDAIWKNPK